MPKTKTSISIQEPLLRQAQAWGNAQRPSWSFSALVEIALEDFLVSQGQPVKKGKKTIEDPPSIELLQAM